MDYPATVAALDIGGTKIAGALLSYAEAGTAPLLTCQLSCPTEAARGGQAVLDAAAQLAAKLLAYADENLMVVSGLGVSTAGRVDGQTGAIAYANDIMPGWTGQPVAQHLSQRFNLPVAVLNDVQSHALGEARWGAAQGAQTCVMIAAGTGVGGAIITHGTVLRGRHGYAGEVGHIPCNQAAGIPCTCGGSGHLELVASGSGIEARYAEGGGQALSGGQISQRADEGEELAVRIITQAGTALGEAIAGLTNVLDPDMVVIGGSVAKAGALWRKALQHGFKQQIPPAQLDLPIVQAALGDSAPLVGAAENLLDTLKGN